MSYTNPTQIIACRPSLDCGQSDHCARRHASGKSPIDASGSVTKNQAFCPMFIDRRGLALIGEEILMTKIDTAKPEIVTGRPRGEVSKAVEAQIRNSGVYGMSLEDLRNALPGEKAGSIKYAARHLRQRDGFPLLSHGRLSVYLAPGVDMKTAKKHFAARVAAAQARSAELARETIRRYHRRIAEEGKARRRGQVEEAARLRAERLAAVQRDKEARAAQRLAEQQRKAQLHASKRAEIAANNLLAKKIKLAGRKTPQPVLAALPAATEDWSKAKVTKLPSPPPRFAPSDFVGAFSSMRPGQYAFEPASCAARAAA